jgi:glycosyltransferase involved in cell wall biosynthesis
VPRVVYIQYTNPAGYPPLEHSSRILADGGWQVLFLGTRALGAAALRFPPHPNIRVRCLDFCPAGWRQKLHYLFFCLWVLGWVAIWRPRWVYASDSLACPLALVLCYVPWLRVLYHEHDSPAGIAGANPFLHLVLAARRQMGRRAALCIFPNEGRARAYREEAAGPAPYVVVWNCPSTQEVRASKAPERPDRLLLYYHGNISSHYVPITLLHALATLPGTVGLRVVGYETVGAIGYIRELHAAAERLGIGARVEILEALPRYALLDRCAQCEVGLALFPGGANDVNGRYMTGASNKAFDYLACGLALLVSDLPDWRAAYVEPGYGLACDPDDAESIARAIRRFLDDPELARSMGEKGRQRILSDWNYEGHFLPVYSRLQA